MTATAEETVLDFVPPQARPARRRRYKRLLVVGILSLAVAAAGYAGWQYWTLWRFEVSTDDAYVQADIVDIAPQVAGYIAEVLVTDNQAVKAGEVLARIDQRDYLAALDQAKAQVAAAEADVATYQTLLDLQQASIDEAKATVQVDQATETYAEQNEQRFTTLAKDGYGTVQNAQQAISQTDSAKASIVKDEAAVVVSQKQLDALKAQLTKSQASLAEAEARQRQAELDLGYTIITAPTDGMIGDRTLRVGQYVTVGTQLMAVVPTESVYIVANFKETQLTDVKKGQPAEVVVDTYPDVVFKGHVDSIAPASGQEFALLPPDNATGNFTKIVQRIPVKIVLDDSDLKEHLRPGMSVTATIDVRTATSEK